MAAGKTRKRTVHVRKSKNGKGVFAQKPITKGTVVGKVAGYLTAGDEDGDEHYQMEMDNDLHLQPKAPFRYLNHSCNPNCNLFMWDEDEVDEETGSRHLYVGALKAIREGAELTIDYGWTADYAIPCNCGSKRCRGWIVDKEERHLLKQ